MIVVEHQDQGAGHLRELVDQGSDHSLRGRGLGRAERGDEVARHSGHGPLQGSDGVGEEAGRVVVGAVQREPAGAARPALEPVGQERGLAKARRRRHQGQAGRQPIFEEPGHARPGHQVGPRRAGVQLGRQETTRPLGAHRVTGSRRDVGHSLPLTFRSRRCCLEAGPHRLTTAIILQDPLLRSMYLFGIERRGEPCWCAPWLRFPYQARGGRETALRQVAPFSARSVRQHATHEPGHFQLRACSAFVASGGV